MDWFHYNLELHEKPADELRGGFIQPPFGEAHHTLSSRRKKNEEEIIL